MGPAAERPMANRLAADKTGWLMPALSRARLARPSGPSRFRSGGPNRGRLAPPTTDGTPVRPGCLPAGAGLRAAEPRRWRERRGRYWTGIANFKERRLPRLILEESGPSFPHPDLDTQPNPRMGLGANFQFGPHSACDPHSARRENTSQASLQRSCKP